MANQNVNWDELGRSIQDVVDRAVNSSDYQKLNQTVRQVVEQAVDLGSDVLRGATKTGPNTTGARRTGPNVTGATRTGPVQSPPKTNQLALYRNTGGKWLGALLKTVGGGFLSLIMGLATLGGLISFSIWDLPLLLFCGACFGGGVWMTCSGGSALSRIGRFHTYRRVLGDKTHCKVLKLARAVGKDETFVRKDVQKMISQGLFLEGHLDHEGTNLITSDETYRYYEHNRLQLEERRRLEEAKAQRQGGVTSPQLQAVLDRGNAFLNQLRACNDAIPGEEISAKIDRMEKIVSRIFDRARSNPEVVPELKKLMDYYLPMTVKLLNAYADMDDLPVQSETAANSMREIEQTLDTLNLAFERLLDELFHDTAMDVASDISVLNTLLAQEGLTGSDFK